MNEDLRQLKSQAEEMQRKLQIMLAAIEGYEHDDLESLKEQIEKTQQQLQIMIASITCLEGVELRIAKCGETVY